MGYKKVILYFMVILWLGSLSAGYSFFEARFMPQDGAEEYEEEPAKVLRIVDGDTLEANLSTGKATIRMLGVNTPEKGQAGYSEAKEFLYFLQNKTVLLLRDREDEDRYGRKLRYVFYNGRLINVEILEGGLAIAYMTEGIRYEKKLREAEKYASQAGFGLWKKSSSQCAGCLELVELDPKEEHFTISNRCSMQCDAIVMDEGNHKFDVSLSGNSQKTFFSKGSIWNDDGDRLFLRDEEGLILVYRYP